MDEERTNSFHVTHTWLGKEQLFRAVYEHNRLEVALLGNEPEPGQVLYLTEKETADFLAWIRSLQHDA